MSRYRNILILLGLGLLVRLVLIGISLQYRENTDILRWKDWGRISYLYGFADAYKPDHLTFGTLPANQPPGMVLIQSVMYWSSLQAGKVCLKILHAREGSVPWINGLLPTAILRIPALVADLAIGWLIYVFVKKQASGKSALPAAAFYLFNPAVLYNGAVWGQADALNNVFILAGIMMLLNRKYVLSGIFVAVSFLIKLSLIYLLPFIFVISWMDTDSGIRHSGKRILERIRNRFPITLLVAGTMTISTLLPVFLFSSNPFLWYLSFLRANATGEMRNITNFAFNAWWAFFRPHLTVGKPTDLFSFSEIRLHGSPDISWPVLGIPAGSLAICLFGLCMAIILYLFIRRRSFSPAAVFSVISSLAILSFLILPQMHERYLFPLFPLLAVQTGLTGKMKPWYWILAGLNLLNLYWVWHPFGEIGFLNYHVMNNRSLQTWISIMTVIIGMVTCWKLISRVLSDPPADSRGHLASS